MYYFSDRLAAGGRLSGSFWSSREGDSWSFILSPEVRFHLSQPGRRHQVFLKAGSQAIAFGSFRSNFFSNLKTGVGYNFFVQPNIALEAALEFNNFWHDGIGGGEGAYQSLDLRAGFSVFLHPEGTRSPEMKANGRGQGNWILGGTTAGMTLLLLTEREIFSINLRPNACYFLNDRLLVGANLPLFYTLSETNLSYRMGLLPSLRYYFSGSSRRYHWFAEVRGGWSQYRFKTRLGYDQQERRINNFALSATLGGNYFLRPDIALEAGLSYSNVIGRLKVNRSEMDTERSAGIRFDLGIQFFLRASGAKE